MTTVATSQDRLANLDFTRHNEEARQVNDAMHAGKPIRVPVAVGTATRYFIFNDQANPAHIPFQKFIEDPDVMFDCKLAFHRWMQFNILRDDVLGMPEFWPMSVDFQNFYEAAWFGCPIHYMDDQVPDTTPAFVDVPERVMEHGIPDPFGGLMGKVLEYWEYFQQRAAKETYFDRPIKVVSPGSGMGTDGPMTVACNLFGPNFVCETMMEEPERLERLLSFITEATLTRMIAWRKRVGIPYPTDGFGIADDSIAMISTDAYRRHILPHHRKMFDTMGTGVNCGVHLCGDATRHFKTLRDELKVQSFDTGFPVDFAAIRRELGPNVHISGGPHVDLVLNGTPQEVFAECRRVLTSGIMEGGRFLLREGNNLAPYTPLENTEMMLAASRQFGVYPK
ncbi:MAG: uroporphyrinogen decarboxylase family protein [Phycisphaerae bacterium]